MNLFDQLGECCCDARNPVMIAHHCRGIAGPHVLGPLLGYEELQNVPATSAILGRVEHLRQDTDVRTDRNVAADFEIARLVLHRRFTRISP